MLRETKVFECFSADDIYDAVEFSNNRTDGGKTIIKLNYYNAPYVMNRPLYCKDCQSNPVVIEMDGLIITNGTSENDWKIERI